MKNSKRTLALLLALLMTSSALLSCSSGETGETSSGDNAATEETVAETEPPFDPTSDDVATVDFNGASYTVGGNSRAHPQITVHAIVKHFFYGIIALTLHHRKLMKP